MAPLPLGPALVAAATRQAGHEVYVPDLMDRTDPPVAVRDAPRFLLAQPRTVVDSIRCAEAVDDRGISSDHDLLEPRSYLADGLDGRVRQRLAR